MSGRVQCAEGVHTVQSAECLHVEREAREVYGSVRCASACIHYSLSLGKEEWYVAPRECMYSKSSVRMYAVCGEWEIVPHAV